MKRPRARVRLIGVGMLALLALALPFSLFASSTTTTVKQSSMAGWFPADTRSPGTGTFVSGPASPPLGSGSFRLSTITNPEKVQFFTNAYDGVALSAISGIGYSTYRDPASTGFVAGVAALNMRVDLTGDAAPDAYFVYEPYQDQGNAAVLTGSWQTWDAYNGGAAKWWINTGAGGCGQATPCTWSAILTAFPTATIEEGANCGPGGATSPCPGSFGLNQGSFNSGTISYADALTITVSGNQATYNFEPETPCTTDCYVDAATGNDANGGDSPSSAKKTIQAAVNQVSTGGTVHVANGTYNENVNVARAMTILGNQAGNAVSGRTAAAANESTIVAVPTGAGSGAVEISAANVTLNGFSIRNNAVTVGAATGVQLNAAADNAVIKFNMLDGIKTSDTGGQGAAQGIYLVGGPDGAMLRDNLVTNINGFRSSKAIFVGDGGSSNPSANVTIKDNVLSNVTSTGRGGYGVLVNNGNGSTANSGLSIDGNQISSIAGPSGWAHAIGLEANTPGASVTKNVISNVTSPSADKIAVWFESNPGFSSSSVNRNSLNVGPAAGILVHPSLTGGSVDGTCNWWGDGSGPSGAGSGSGSAVGPNVAFSPWLLSNNLNGNCIGGTANGDKQYVLSVLQGMIPSGDAKTDKRIQKAIDRLEKSLTVDWWTGPMALDPKDGKHVFDEEKKVVHELSKKELAGNTTAQSLIQQIVAVDRSLAQYQIDNPSPGVTAKDIAKANDEMAKGDADATAGKAESAIEHYKQAWDKVAK